MERSAPGANEAAPPCRGVQLSPRSTLAGKVVNNRIFSLILHHMLCLHHSTGSPSAKQSSAQGTRSPAPKVHTGTFLSSGVKVSHRV